MTPKDFYNKWSARLTLPDRERFAWDIQQVVDEVVDGAEMIRAFSPESKRGFVLMGPGVAVAEQPK